MTVSSRFIRSDTGLQPEMSVGGARLQRFPVRSGSNSQCEVTPLRNGVVAGLRGSGEPVPGVGHEGIEPDPLGACPMAEVMAILTAAPGGEAHVDPVGGPVAMSGKAGGIDEGLGQEGLDAVGDCPITDDRA